MLINGLALLFVLGVMILVHELGHFWIARKVGIRVEKFSLGFGPKLFGFTRDGIEYQVTFVPLGGYVKLAGDEAFEDNYVAKPGDYMACPWWGRSLMALAGPAANLVTAFLIFVIIGLTGVRQPDFEAVVGIVPAEGLAYKVGVRPGDRIAAIGGITVESWHQAELAWQRADQGTNDRVMVVLDRQGRSDTIRVMRGSREQWFAGLVPRMSARLGDIAPGYPAYQAGLKKGDLVLSVNGAPVSTWQEMRALIITKADQDVRLVVLRNSDTLRILLKPVSQPNGEAVIGISGQDYGSYRVYLNPLDAAGNAALTIVRSISFIYRTLFRLITKPSTGKQLGSILMIGELAGESAKKGFDILLQLIASLSIMLFVMNLLPLPVLDGGVIFFSLLEGVRRRALPVKVQAVIQQVGIVLLFALMALALANDGLSIAKRWSALRDKAPREQPK